MKSRLVLLVLVVVVVLLAAPSSFACERCRQLIGGNSTCWSGMPTGYQWCYGGFGEPCTMGDYCEEPQAAPRPPGHGKQSAPVQPNTPVRNQERPEGGFMIRRG